MSEEKPQRKREVAIIKTEHYPSGLWSITFAATPEAAKDLEDFGQVKPWTSVKDAYYLILDPRFDVEEVSDYINNYDQQEPLDFLAGESEGPPLNV